jgi:hypothetical protein
MNIGSEISNETMILFLKYLAERDKGDVEDDQFIREWSVLSRLQLLQSEMEDTGVDPSEDAIRRVFKVDGIKIDRLEQLTASLNWGRRYWFIIRRGRITASVCHKVSFLPYLLNSVNEMDKILKGLISKE